MGAPHTTHLHQLGCAASAIMARSAAWPLEILYMLSPQATEDPRAELVPGGEIGSSEDRLGISRPLCKL